MKRFKQPKPNRVSLSDKDLRKMKEEITDYAVGTASLLYMEAIRDEFGFGMDDIEKVFIRASRYAKYIDEHVVSMKTLADDLEKNTGIRIKWR